MILEKIYIPNLHFWQNSALGNVKFVSQSGSGDKLTWSQANSLAEKIRAEINNACQKIETVGSLRRKQPACGDIEFVVIPVYQTSLVDDIPGVSQLDMVLEQLVAGGRLIKANRGEVSKKFYVPYLQNQGLNFCIEIYVSTAERWPVETAIRTGPTGFSKQLVTQHHKNGLLPSDCHIDEGWLVWRGHEQILFKSERDFIEFCCDRWIPPEQRN